MILEPILNQITEPLLIKLNDVATTVTLGFGILLEGGGVLLMEDNGKFLLEEQE